MKNTGMIIMMTIMHKHWIYHPHRGHAKDPTRAIRLPSAPAPTDPMVN